MANTEGKVQSKRHLIRWNEALDKKLLLCIQWACNQEGLKIPWTEVGELMNDNNTGGSITEGAIVQHLAKTRIRMVEEDLPVPPPLKRGGKTRISTFPKVVSRHAGVEKASRRRTTASGPKSGGAVDKQVVSVIVKARGKTRKARKLKVEDDESDDDGEYDEEAGDGTWMPRSEQNKATAKASGQSMGKLKKVEDGSVDETLSQPDKIGNEGEHIRILSEAVEHEDESDEEIDGDDIDDKTVSNASGGFVGSNACFLPAESVASDTLSSETPESFLVTLHLGKANASKLAMLAGANFHQTDSDQYHVGEGMDYLGGLNNGDVASRYAVAPYKFDDGEETGVLEGHTPYEEPQASPLQSSPMTALTMSDGAGNSTATARPYPDHVGLYSSLMPFGPMGNDFSSRPTTTVVDPRFDLLGPTYFENQHTIPQHDHWPLASSGGLVQTPAAIEYATMAAGSFLDTNMNVSMHDLQSGDTHGVDGTNNKFGSFDHTANAHTYMPSNFPEYCLPRLGAKYTNTTNSSSTNGSLSTDISSNVAGSYYREPNFEGTSIDLDAKEHMLGHLDGKDTIDGLAAHNNFDLDFL